MAVPKKKKDEETAKVVAPQTLEQKASDALTDLLAEAAKARTVSIKLNTVEYAQDLSAKLLDHASKLEGFYATLQDAVQKKRGDKVLQGILSNVASSMEFGEKAQAWSFSSLDDLGIKLCKNSSLQKHPLYPKDLI